MQRRVNDFQRPFVGQRHAAGRLVVGRIHPVAHKFKQAFFAGGIEGHRFNLFDVGGHFVDQELIVGGDQLPAILVIDLFSVVGGQVVTGAEHVPRDGVEIPDGKRKLGCAADGLKQINLYSVGRIYGGSGFGQGQSVEIHDRIGKRVVVYSFLSVFADIKGQHHPALPGRLTILIDEILAVALGRGLDGPGVDAVGADAHQPPAASGAEGDNLVEGIQ